MRKKKVASAVPLVVEPEWLGALVVELLHTHVPFILSNSVDGSTCVYISQADYDKASAARPDIFDAANVHHGKSTYFTVKYKKPL